MTHVLIIVADVLCLVFSLGGLVYAFKLQQEYKIWPFVFTAMASVWTSFLRTFRLLAEFDIHFFSSNGMTAAFIVFYILNFLSIAGMYYGLKKFLRVK